MIGGNINATLQVKGVESVNEIGEKELGWKDSLTLVGWLDFQSGEASYKNLNAKVQESTHLFICDYVALLQDMNAENTRILIDGVVYDVLYIDDPMNLHQHLEIFLKMTGGVSNGN